MIADWERQRTFEITEPSHTAEVRRFATQLAQAAGFNESEAGGVALVTTELATNLLKHASSGEIVVRPVVHGPVPGVELLALDRGLGISNLAQCLRTAIQPPAVRARVSVPSPDSPPNSTSNRSLARAPR
jgi:anti-sigma regulatory factor (Ser/Thr protein kinase)